MTNSYTTRYVVYIPAEFSKYFAGETLITSFGAGKDPERNTLEQLLHIFKIPEDEQREFLLRAGTFLEEDWGTNNLSDIPDYFEVYTTILAELSPEERLSEYQTGLREAEIAEAEAEIAEEEALAYQESRPGLAALAPSLGVTDLRDADFLSKRLLDALSLKGLPQINQSIDYLVYFWMQANPNVSFQDAIEDGGLQEGIRDFMTYALTFEEIRAQELAIEEKDREIARLQFENPDDPSIAGQHGVERDALFTTIDHIQTEQKELQDKNVNNAWWGAGTDIAFVPDMFTAVGIKDVFGKPDLVDVEKYDITKSSLKAGVTDRYGEATDGLSLTTFRSIIDLIDDNFDDWYQDYRNAFTSGTTSELTGSIWIEEQHSNEAVFEIIERQNNIIDFGTGVLAELYDRAYGGKAGWTGGEKPSSEIGQFIEKTIRDAFDRNWNSYDSDTMQSFRELYPNKDDYWKSLSTAEIDGWINTVLRGMVRRDYGESGQLFLNELEFSGQTMMGLLKSWGTTPPGLARPLGDFDPTTDDLAVFFESLQTYSEINPDLTRLQGEIEPETMAGIMFLNNRLGDTINDLPSWLADELLSTANNRLARALEGANLTEANADDIWDIMLTGDAGDGIKPLNSVSILSENILNSIERSGLENSQVIIDFLTGYADEDGNTGVLNGFKSLTLDWSDANTEQGFWRQLRALPEDIFPAPEAPTELPTELAGVLPAFIDYLPAAMRIDAAGLASRFFESEWLFQSTVGDDPRLTREQLAGNLAFQESLGAFIENTLDDQFNEPFVSLIIEYAGGLRKFFEKFESFSQLSPAEIVAEVRKTILNPPEGAEGHLQPQFLNAEVMDFVAEQLQNRIEFQTEFDALYETDPVITAREAELEAEEKRIEGELEEEESEQERIEREAERERQMLASVQITGRTAAEEQFEERFRSTFGAVVGPQLSALIARDNLDRFQTEFLESFEDFKGFLSPDQYVAITGEDFEAQSNQLQFDLAKSDVVGAQEAFFQQFDPDRIMSLTRQAQIGQTRFDAPVARRQRRPLYRSPRTPRVTAGF